MLDENRQPCPMFRVPRLGTPIKGNGFSNPLYHLSRIPDFMFKLAPQEVIDLKSQTVTSSYEGNRSQIVNGAGHGGRRKLTSVFTEHG